MFCNKCGNRTDADALFCNKCGNRFDNAGAAQYQPRQYPGQGQSPQGVKLDAMAQSAKASAAMLADKNVATPGIVFAAASVGAGLVISFLLSLYLNSVTEPHVDGYELFGAVTVWLMTCLSGIAVNISGGAFGASVDVSLGFSIGDVILLLVPALALFIGRKARESYIKSKMPGKTLGGIDGVAGALFFAAINAVLSFFPLSFLEAFSEELAPLSFSGSAITVNTLWFSFVIAVLFSMPGINVLTRGTGLISSSLMTAVNHALRMALAGLFVAVFLNIYLMTEFGDYIKEIPSRDMKWFILAVIAALPNLGVWLMSVITGGSFGATVDIPKQLAEAIETRNTISTSAAISGFGSGMGIILLILGLCVAVISLYPKLRHEQDIVRRGIAVAVLSGGMVWALSTLAGFGFTANIRGSFLGFGESVSGGLSITSATLGTLIGAAAIGAAAAAVIHFIRTMPSIDNLLARITANTGTAIGVTAGICVLITAVVVRIATSSQIARSVNELMNGLNAISQVMDGISYLF